jgi:hypothetical protein
MTMIRRLSVRARVAFRDEVDAGALSDVNCAFATSVDSVGEAAGARSMTYLNPGAPSPGGSRNRRWTLDQPLPAAAQRFGQFQTGQINNEPACGL